MTASILEMASAMRMQDNRSTSHPIFSVQVKIRLLTEDTSEGVTYLDEDWFEVPESEWGDDPDNNKLLTRIGVAERWEHVQAFFTQEGANAYIRNYKHRYRSQELRVYVDSAHSNSEWQAVCAHIEQCGRDVQGIW